MLSGLTDASGKHEITRKVLSGLTNGMERMLAIEKKMRDPEKSSYTKLAQYITNTLGKTERIYDVFVANCVSEDPEMAMQEAEITQMQNTTATSNKTYHLLVTFPATDNPDKETLKIIELELCKAIGFEEHHRITVVHKDTDNTHMHVAINRIHPKTLKSHNPYRDWKTLADASEKLETRFNLEKTNHKPQKSQSENRIADMERHSGQESFASYVKNECSTSLDDAKTWEEVHQNLAKYGVSLQLRGNGLVFIDTRGEAEGDPYAVKASTVNRNYSKGKLTKRLGDYTPPNDQDKTQAPEKKYDKKPINIPPESPLLRDFTAAKTRRYVSYTKAMSELSASYKEERAALELAHKEARKKISRYTTRMVRKSAYDKTLAGHKKRLKELSNKYETARNQVRQYNHKVTWVAWLQDQAEKGREDAIEALRKRAYGLVKKGASVTGDEIINPETSKDAPISHVTKTGTVVFRVGNEAVRDDGDRFYVSKDSGMDTAIMALRLAKQRYGDVLTITGKDEMKEKILQAAIKARLKITFSDPDMEKRRRDAMRELWKEKMNKKRQGKGKKHERR